MQVKFDLEKLSQAELAVLWGCSTRTIQRLPINATLRHGSGQGCYYVWSECRFHMPGLVSQGRTGALEDLSHADRLKKVKADDAELDMALKLGTLLVASNVRETWAKECAAMRARLLSIPSTAALRIGPNQTQAEREAIIRKDIYEALEALSGATE